MDINALGLNAVRKALAFFRADSRNQDILIRKGSVSGNTHIKQSWL